MHASTRAPMRSHLSRLTTLMVGLLALLLVTPQVAYAATTSQAPDFTVKVQGIVYGAASLPGGRTVVGGDFTGIGSQAHANVGAFLKTGYADGGFNANTDGIVYAVAASADSSTIYIGGTFTQVNGVARANLAALDATTGAVKETWQADTNGAVRAMEVYGDVLYVGGSFTTLGGTQKGRLVSLDTSGVLRPGFVPKPDWTVRDLAVSSDGTKVYASGGFKNIGGAARNCAAELDATTGKATAFNPNKNGDIGLAIDVTPDGSRLFFSVPNNEVYGFDLATSQLVWTTKAGGDTQAIEATNDEVFIGGHFRNITTYKVKRNLLASLNVSDGTVTAWDPHLSGDMGPWTMHIAPATQSGTTTIPEKLVVGGDFGYVGGAPRAGMTRFTRS